MTDNQTMSGAGCVPSSSPDRYDGRGHMHEQDGEHMHEHRDEQGHVHEHGHRRKKDGEREDTHGHTHEHANEDTNQHTCEHTCERTHEQEHMHTHEHTHEQEHMHTHEHTREHTYEHKHTHEQGHVHAHDPESDPAHGHGHMHRNHSHSHDPKEMRKIINRLSRLIGHLESVKRMIEDGQDCSDVLIQLAAVRSEINGAGKALLKEHLDHCIVEAVREHDEESIEKMNRAIDQFMK